MIRKDYISLLLLLVTCLSIVFGLNGSKIKFDEPVVHGLIYGIISSILASIAWSFIVVINSHESRDKYLGILASRLAPHLLRQLNGLPDQVHRIDRNLRMGEEYWKEVISDLDCSQAHVYFCGTSMALWLDTPYQSLLEKKMTARIRNAISSSSDDTYCTIIAICDAKSLSMWEDFLDSCKLEAIKGSRLKPDAIQIKVNKKLRIIQHTLSHLTYSAVLCGKRMAVTAYVSKGRSQDSPTFDIVYESELWNLYFTDMKNVISNIDKSPVSDYQ